MSPNGKFALVNWVIIQACWLIVNKTVRLHEQNKNIILSQNEFENVVSISSHFSFQFSTCHVLILCHVNNLRRYIQLYLKTIFITRLTFLCKNVLVEIVHISTTMCNKFHTILHLLTWHTGNIISGLYQVYSLVICSEWYGHLSFSSLIKCSCANNTLWSSKNCAHGLRFVRFVVVWCRSILPLSLRFIVLAPGK